MINIISVAAVETAEDNNKKMTENKTKRAQTTTKAMQFLFIWFHPIV